MTATTRAVVDRPSVDNFVDNDFVPTCRQGSCTGDNIKFEKHWKNQRHRTCSTWDKRRFSYVWALKLHHKTLISNLVYCYFLPCMPMACCNVFFLVKLLIYFHIISHNFVLLLSCKLSTEHWAAMFVYLSHLPHWWRKEVQCSGRWPRHQTHHFALIVQYLILHACSGVFALNYFHEILVSASVLFYYHFLLSVQAKKIEFVAYKKKKKQFNSIERTALLICPDKCTSWFGLLW